MTPTKGSKRDRVAVAFQRSERARVAVIVNIALLSVCFALLAVGVTGGVRHAVETLAIVLAVVFAATFVTAAVTSIEFRRARDSGRRKGLATPRSRGRRDWPVYVLAFGSAAAVGALYFTSLRHTGWAWPTFVVLSLVVAVGLIVRRRR